MVVFNATCRKYSEQISLSGGVGQEEFWMEIRRVGEVDAEEAKRKLRDLKEVAMSIKPMIELAKKKSLGGVCPIKDFFLILRGTETSSALRYLVSKLWSDAKEGDCIVEGKDLGDLMLTFLIY